MALTLDDLYASPGHYLHSFEGDAAVFVPMDRAAYHRSIFLDGRIQPAGTGTMRLPFATLANRVPAPRPTAWIFHVAHCGSTLLARALDRPDGNLVLREPLALRQLAMAADAGDVPLRVTAAMLGKRYADGAPTIVKANVPVNFLLPAITALDAGAPAIFVHLPLRDYLLAILRDEDHRVWLRTVTTNLAHRIGSMQGWPDADRAAALWLAQVRAFAIAIVAMPNARSLDAETFFAAPVPVLAAASALFGAPMAATEIARVVAGPLFATYSKNPAVAFDNAARIARQHRAEADLADELVRAERKIGRDADAALAVIASAALLA